MRIRGRRVALLLASAFPLLAEEHPISTSGRNHDPENVAVTDAESVVGQKSQEVKLQDVYERLDADENDDSGDKVAASEAIYSDGFRLPPLPGSSSTQPMAASPQLPFNEADDSVLHKIETDSEREMHFAEKTDGKKPPDSEPPGLSEESTNTAGQSEEVQDEPSDLEPAPNQTVAVSDEKEPTKQLDGNHSLNETLPEASGASNATNSSSDEQQESSTGTEQHDTTTIESDDDEDVSLSRVSVDYASKSAGALIIEKSSEFKGTSNLLNGDKDRYAISPCENKKFVVISLSEDILVKQIKLANYERFSSTVKDFQVMGSQTLGKWADLGTYSAKPGNGEQTFDLLSPAWARYLKFKFLSHHGVEYYCTYSQIKVHGSTMVQGFHEQWEESKEEDDEEDVASVSIETENETETENEKLMKAVGEAVDEMVNATQHANESSESSSMLQLEKENSETENGIHCSNSSGDTAGKDFCRLPLSKELGEKLNGAVGLSDDELLSSLYDLIPSTLSTLPKTSRNSPGRQTTGGVLRTLHEIESLAVQSLYATSRKAADAAMFLVSNSSEGSIKNPRMSERVGDAFFHYLGTELGLLSGMLGDPDTMKDAKEPKEAYPSVDANKEEDKNVGGVAVDTVETLDGVNSMSTGTEAKVPSNDDSQDGDGKNDLYIKTPAPSQEAHEVQGAAEYTLDPSLIKMLEKLPSAECLSKLDFGQYKAKMIATKKSHTTSGASSSSGAAAMEPIFKKLTDEIKNLQNNLSIHDHFAKASTACYQRILLDLILELERLRIDHEERLRKLENEYFSSPANLLWKLCLTCTAVMRKIVKLVFSASLRLFAPLLSWLASVSRGIARLPGAIFRQLLLKWPIVKDFLLSNSDGSTSELAKYIRPLTDHMDMLVESFFIADANQSIDEPSSNQSEEMWMFPVLPIMLLVLVGRVIMCFTNPAAKLGNLPSNSELRAWRANNKLSGRNQILSKSSSPSVTLTNAKALPSVAKGESELTVKKTRSPSMSGAEKENRPPLISEPSPDKPTVVAEPKGTPSAIP